MSNQKHHYAFVHNVFGKFIETTRDYFVEDLFPRFEWSVLGTYDKAVEYFNKQQQSKGESYNPPDEGPPPQQPELPALIINPLGEMNLDEARHGSKQMYRFPNLSPGLLPYLYDPIYKDDNVIIVPGFTRLKGELECIALLNSFYEYFDFRILLLQAFGGLERPIYPNAFESFLIIDSKLQTYKYENDVSNVVYELDWLNNGASNYLIQTTNRNEVIYPCRIRPYYTLNSQSDQSERYGGADKLAEYKLGFTISYEIEIPTSLIVFENLDLSESERHILMNITYGSSKSEYLLKDEYYTTQYNNDVEDVKNNVIFPTLQNTIINEIKDKYSDLADFSYDENGNIIKKNQYPPINSTVFESNITKSGEVDNIEEYELSVINRYCHVLSNSDLEENYIDIDLPIIIENLNYVTIGGFRVNSKIGELNLKEQFDIIKMNDNYDTLRVYLDKIDNLLENDLIEFFYYQIK